MERGLSRGQGEQQVRRVLIALAVLGGVAAVVLGPVLSRVGEHNYYQLSYETSVETWSMGLPFGFRVVRQKSVPAGPHDGFRVYRKGPGE